MMKKDIETSIDPIWTMIEKEKKKDLLLKRVGRIAWSGTLIVLLAFLGISMTNFLKAYKAYKAGAVPYDSVMETIIPFLLVLGILSLVIGILSTVGMFLRLRTANLLEIQQRLANLETMITAKDN